MNKLITSELIDRAYSSQNIRVTCTCNGLYPAGGEFIFNHEKKEIICVSLYHIDVRLESIEPVWFIGKGNNATIKIYPEDSFKKDTREYCLYDNIGTQLFMLLRRSIEHKKFKLACQINNDLNMINYDVDKNGKYTVFYNKSPLSAVCASAMTLIL